MPTLQELQSEIRDLELLGEVAPDQCQALLEERDEPGFDGEWMRVYTAVQDSEVEGEIQKSNVLIDEIRESTYTRAFQLTRNAELAGAVSDDFDLIARAVQIGYEDPWLDEMWEEYEAGRFPS